MRDTPTQNLSVGIKAVTEHSEEVLQHIKSLVDLAWPRARLRNINEDNRSEKLTEEDRKDLIVSLGMRFTPSEALRICNGKREARGDSPITMQTVYRHQARYADLIDEIWATSLIRIGEIYSYTDKFYRLGRYNELARSFHRKAMEEANNPVVTDAGIKIVNTYIKILDRIHIEMGGVALSDMIKRLDKKKRSQNNGEDENGVVQTPEEAKQVMESELLKRYQSQLPPSNINENTGTGTDTKRDSGEASPTIQE